LIKLLLKTVTIQILEVFSPSLQMKHSSKQFQLQGNKLISVYVLSWLWNER